MKIDTDEVHFQQDGAMCHTSNASMMEIESYLTTHQFRKKKKQQKKKNNLWPP
jgi:hypothetical protein